MFGNIGIMEFIIILGLALVFVGPEKFPEFTKIMMRTIRDIRNYINDIKQDIADEMRPVKNEVRQLSRYRPEDYIESIVDSVTEDEESPSATPPPSTSGDASESPPKDAAPAESSDAQGNYYDPAQPPD